MRGVGLPNQTPAIHLIINQGVENNPNCLLIAKLPTMGFFSEAKKLANNAFLLQEG